MTFFNRSFKKYDLKNENTVLFTLYILNIKHLNMIDFHNNK